MAARIAPWPIPWRACASQVSNATRRRRLSRTSAGVTIPVFSKRRRLRFPSSAIARFVMSPNGIPALAAGARSSRGSALSNPFDCGTSTGQVAILSLLRDRTIRYNSDSARNIDVSSEMETQQFLSAVKRVVGCARVQVGFLCDAPI